MKFQVEKGVEIPPRRGGGDVRYPLGEMEVGDSFEFPLEFRGSVQTLASAAKKQGRVFMVKKIGPETCRVWRLE